jgi:hypothetical protein
MELPRESTAESDRVIRLREWGTNKTHILPQPQPPYQGWLVGSSPECLLQINDIRVSPTHADLSYQRGAWWIRDLWWIRDGGGGSERCQDDAHRAEHARVPELRQDGVPRWEFALVSGVEVGIGATTLIAESPCSIALRDFCARLLGWGDAHMSAVDHALRALRLAMGCRSPLILRGDEDLVPIAYALHRLTLGVDAPFAVCDPRRQTVDASVRSHANYQSGMVAFTNTVGGTLCMRSRRPDDFAELLARLHEPDPRVALMICASRNVHLEYFAAPVPICVPSLKERAMELPRIVEAYAADAIAALRPERPEYLFTADDLRWVIARAATSLAEIEKATLRIVAIRTSANIRQAAARLGMAPVSLSRWLNRSSQSMGSVIVGQRR